MTKTHLAIGQFTLITVTPVGSLLGALSHCTRVNWPDELKKDYIQCCGYKCDR